MASNSEDHYLIRTVAKPLVEAVVEVCEKRPTDPIEYIAGYLHNYQQQCAKLPVTGVQSLSGCGHPEQEQSTSPRNASPPISPDGSQACSPLMSTASPGKDICSNLSSDEEDYGVGADFGHSENMLEYYELEQKPGFLIVYHNQDLDLLSENTNQMGSGSSKSKPVPKVGEKQEMSNSDGKITNTVKQSPTNPKAGSSLPTHSMPSLNKKHESHDNQQPFNSAMNTSLPAQRTETKNMHIDQAGSTPNRQTNNPESTFPAASNTFNSSMVLPECTTPTLPVDFPYISGKSHGRWPITNYAALDINVNVREGGMASLILISNAYGADGADTTCQMFVHRCGYADNYHSCMSVAHNHHGHFSASNSFLTAEDGSLIAQTMFGNNHVAVLSNNPRYGNLSHGVFIQGGDGPVNLLLDVNGSRDGDHGGGCTLVLCSGWESGVDSASMMHAVYMLRSGHKGDNVQKVLIRGEDKWEFSANGSTLQAEGLNKTMFALYHNREGFMDGGGNGVSKTWHAETMNGLDRTDIADVVETNGIYLVLCSHSVGIEDCTAAAMFIIMITDGKPQITDPFILTGKMYENSEDLWKFEVSGSCLRVTGPKGPCRYAVMSNLKVAGQSKPIPVGCCLATGFNQPIRGAVTINEESVIGWVDQQCEVIIKINKKAVAIFPAGSLKKENNKYAFSRAWTDEEKSVGYMVGVYCIITGADSQPVEMELEGSPSQIIYQPQGVVYALNCGSPAYQALNDIVYTSEHHQFVNFSYDCGFGTRSRAKGGMKPHSSEPKIHTGTHDGFLYMTCRATGVEAEHERHVIYEVPNLSTGKMILRLHSVKASAPKSILMNGEDITAKVEKLMKQKRSSGLTGITIDVPIELAKNQLTLELDDHMLCAFAVLDKTYKEKTPSKEAVEIEKMEKQKLVDKVEPLNRQLTKKERKILGWSPNLLQNASGEAGDTSNWSIESGDWKVTEGGYGTEKAFVTSHMCCVKAQEVDLTQHFSKEYLDTAPEIQVSEWYREGCCGGGYYTFETILSNKQGQDIDKFESGKIGNLYRSNKWTEAEHTFRNYGPGAEVVSIRSSGQDDKYWGGHYGPLMSTAVIRVKTQVTPQENDAYQDVILDMDESVESSGLSGRIDSLISRVLADTKGLVHDMIQDDVLGDMDPKVLKQMEVTDGTKVKRGHRSKRKKRELRVFVSSTFKDFKSEREHLIKKTFRELNSLCIARGVFFTYVDLRWGITEEQTNHGKTIAICLKEIERCQPYFICMAGKRFGWSQQEDKPDALLNQSFDYAVKNYPKELSWVEKHRYDCSVTQLEILHGVLNDVPNRKDHSFFYLRDSIQPEDVPGQDIKIFCAESDWHGEKQQALRQTIQQTKGLNVYSYKKPEEVGLLIKQDLESCLDQDFPKGTELTSLEKEREAHMAFAEARRRIYIGREAYFTEIDQYMYGEGRQPLVILGESGAGKSALVANWVGRVEEREPEAFMFVHFIGSSAKSVSHIRLIRRLFEELKEFFRLELTVPSSDSNLVRDLGTWLNMAASQTKCYIVLDALNQLDDGSGTEGNEHDLQWLPRTLPHGLQILVSTLPGRALDAARAANWPVMTVSPLQESEKMEILTGYLEGIYGKTLSQDQKTMIVAANQTNNPLYLKALLDEVRMYGNFRTLTAKIKEYLIADTPGDLFAKILERLEQDFESGLHTRPGLVRETTTAIWCSDRGMSEAELRELLQVPSALWSPFYLSLVENLVNRDGIVNFFHDHLRQAVEKKYLSSKEDKVKGYLWLAEYFENKDMDDRKVDELPTLLFKAGAMDRLQTTITNLHIFRQLTLTEEGTFDLIKFWKQLGDYSMAETSYMEAMKAVPESERDSLSHREIQQALAEFFMDLGLYTSAKLLLESVLSQLENEYQSSHSNVLYWPTDHTHQYRCVHPTVIELLIRLGTVCYKQHNLTEASEYYSDANRRIDHVKTPAQKLQLTEALLGWANVYLEQDNMPEAMKYLVRAREIATELLGPRHHYVSAIINNLGQLCYTQGRIDEALGYFIQDLVLTRGEVGMLHPRVAGILNEIALVYDDKNNKKAGELYEAALIVLLDTYGSNHIDVAMVRHNLGAFYFSNDSFLRAKYQLEQAKSVFSTFLGPDHPDAQETASALSDVLCFL